jgi:hypothetical protein
VQCLIFMLARCTAVRQWYWFLLTSVVAIQPGITREGEKGKWSSMQVISDHDRQSELPWDHSVWEFNVFSSAVSILTSALNRYHSVKACAHYIELQQISRYIVWTCFATLFFKKQLYSDLWNVRTTFVILIQCPQKDLKPEGQGLN